MNKKIWMSLGATVLALQLMSGGAEARKVSYEINGKRFTYDTNDPQQVAAARKRIEAANAADAARAKAEAEKASTPLVSVFGSQAQNEAMQAKERLDQVLAEEEAAEAARKQERAPAPRKDAQAREPAEDQARITEDGRDKKGKSKDAALDQQAPANVTTTDAAEEPATQQVGTKPMVKSVSFDIESGIKTIIMSDGSIQEEPFDSNMLAKLAFEQDSSGSLTEFVNQIRKASPGETTGSTAPRVDAVATAPAPKP